MLAADDNALQPPTLRDTNHLAAIVDLNERPFFARDLPTVVCLHGKTRLVTWR